MKKILSVCSGLFVLASSGCGGGGGGTGTPNILTETMYKGQVHDQQFGDYQVDIHVGEETIYPGRVAPQLFFTKLDVKTGRLSDQTRVDVIQPTGQFSEIFVPFQDNRFNANMGVWPAYTPVGNPNNAVCHIQVSGDVTPGLKPGSTLTLSYSSTDCAFAKQGNFVADYSDVLVHDAN